MQQLVGGIFHRKQMGTDVYSSIVSSNDYRMVVGCTGCRMAKDKHHEDTSTHMILHMKGKDPGTFVRN